MSRFLTRPWALCLGAILSLPALAGHPGPQPQPGPSTQTLSADGKTTFVVTKPSLFPESDPFANPPGTNHLENVDSNMIDLRRREIPNTLPSTKAHPYNLHPDPRVEEIEKTSPTDDLRATFDAIQARLETQGSLDGATIQRAIDILEGNPVPGRAYSGFPLLHYKGPEKVGVVQPFYDALGNKIGGSLNIHQIWYDSHIESDTAFIDPSLVWDVPYTLTYTIDVLNRGHDDFSPMVMHFYRTSDPGPLPKTPAEDGSPIPAFAMDATFFPMEEGTRMTFDLHMAPGRYLNLIYTWGWRQHPPRVQVSENALKGVQGVNLVDWERQVFGAHPSASQADKLAAIARIGNLSPAKRMWQGLHQLGINTGYRLPHADEALKVLDQIRRAFAQWQDRTQLPDGVKEHPGSHVTLFYVNNTLYGRMAGMIPGADNQAELPQWTRRGFTAKIHLINGDYFEHSYTNVDFGGQRGWENQFQSTMDIGGSGALFSFGRFHYAFNAGAPGKPELVITVPPAVQRGFDGSHDQLAEHDVEITFNFEPSRRLRMYQFDPKHHDVAVWSVH